jgi:hypothetical protein
MVSFIRMLACVRMLSICAHVYLEKDVKISAHTGKLIQNLADTLSVY